MKNSKKCYTCKPRGTIKEHIISKTEHFTFNHDMFNRPLIIITSNEHFHTIDDMSDSIKLSLFNDIRFFVDFWNLNKNYQLMINNGESQTHHHFHVKMKINNEIATRMRRDHFTRINLEKSYEGTGTIPETIINYTSFQGIPFTGFSGAPYSNEQTFN